MNSLAPHPSIRLVIAAAYASVRAGLHALLGGTSEIEIVAEVSGSAELARLLPEIRAEVVLADDLPDDRARLLACLANGEAGLVLLGEARDGWRPLTAAPLPGWAYLLKEADGVEIAGAIRAVAAGLIVLDRSVTPWADGGVWLSAPPAQDEAARGEALTVREREVLHGMALGLPNKQIAVRLNISLHTAKFHVASVLAKLGAASRTEAVAIGARRGVVNL